MSSLIFSFSYTFLTHSFWIAVSVKTNHRTDCFAGILLSTKVSSGVPVNCIPWRAHQFYLYIFLSNLPSALSHGCHRLASGLTQLKQDVGFLVQLIFISRTACDLCLSPYRQLCQNKSWLFSQMQNQPANKVSVLFREGCLAQTAKSWLECQTVFTFLILYYQKVSLND